MKFIKRHRFPVTFFYFKTENIFVIYIKINIKFAKFNLIRLK